MVDGILLTFKKPENISKKIQSFAHGEFNKERLINEKNIQKNR